MEWRRVIHLIEQIRALASRTDYGDRAEGANKIMNPYTISGLFAGAVLGFFVGRRYAEYHRAERDVATIRAGQKTYRNTRSAMIAAVLLFVIGVILFGILTPV